MPKRTANASYVGVPPGATGACAVRRASSAIVVRIIVRVMGGGTMIIRSTRVLLPTGIQPAEIEIAGEQIVAVRSATAASDFQPPPSSVHDCGGLLVMPGLVDT